MRHSVSIAIFLSLVLLTTVNVTAQTTTEQAANPSAALVQHLAIEVTKLRLEVTELKLELQQAKVARLERELQQLQTDKRKLVTRRAELQHEIATIDQNLNLPLEPEERAEMESTRIALTEKAPEKLRAEEQRLVQQESELNGQLQQEQERLQELKERLERLQNKG
jgi:hypothetical protein